MAAASHPFAACVRFFFASLTWLGAAAQYQLNVWTADNGLPQNIVRGITQTPDGYLWLATFDGLVRFDGVRFTVFNKSNTPGLRSNRVLALHQGVNGDLWLGTESGTTRFQGGKFTAYSRSQGLPSEMVSGVHGDQKENIWVLSGGTILGWSSGDTQFHPVRPSNAALNFQVDRWRADGGFWAVDNGTLHWFKEGKFHRFGLPAALRGANIPYVAEGRDGCLWLWTYGTGAIWKRDIRNESEFRRVPRAQAIETHEDSSRYKWTFSVGDDLIRTLRTESGGQVKLVPFASSFEDREGNLWLGTEGEGLYRVRRQGITVYSRQQGLVDRNVYPIFQDQQGAVWIGAWNSGVSRFDNGSFKNFTVRDGLQSGLVTAIAQDRSGTLWVGAHMSLRVFKGGRFIAPPHRILPPEKYATAIYEDPQGALWVGFDSGLARYLDGKSTLFTVRNGLATDDVKCVIPAGNGGIWVGGAGGLTLIRNGSFTRWTEHDGLSSDSIRALYEDADGVLWIGTYDGGLVRFKNGTFTTYTINEGLFNNGVFQILEDNRHRFWISCNRGIYRVDKAELNDFATGKRPSVTSVPYGKGDGLRNVECNGGYWPAGIRARDGKLWFPTQDGVAVVDPEQMEPNPTPPAVVVESAFVDRAPVSQEPAIVVPLGGQSLEINYTAFSFVSPEHIHFRYRIEGLDQTWTDAGTRRTAFYSHLPPGEYVFRAIAGNRDGIWNTEGAAVALSVLPPFYGTTWFRALAAISIAGAVYLAWRIRGNQLRRAQVAQGMFARQLIASQESERKRIAAEIHDSLGQRLIIIKNLALLNLQQPRDPAHVEAISEETSRAISEVKEISYNLRPYRLDRLGLTKAVEGVLRSASMAGRIEFFPQVDKIDDLLPRDLEINFYRIVQESINNVLKHSNASNVWVTVRYDEPNLLLVVRDDGKGFILPEYSDGQSGFGLLGIRERALLLGGKAFIESKPDEGTTVRVEISLRNPGHA